jgi:trimeric autotransporter adhesin
MKDFKRRVLLLLICVQLSICVAQFEIGATEIASSLQVNGLLATGYSLKGPQKVSTDGSGGFYILDLSKVYHVREGQIQVVAGNGTTGYSGDGGPANIAQLNSPYGLAIDSTGNLYISDSKNYCIRKVNPAGVITTVAGFGTSGYSGDGGPATSARLGITMDIALDPAGSLYIADPYNSRIRKVTPAGIITTVAGNGTSMRRSYLSSPTWRARSALSNILCRK